MLSFLRASALVVLVASTSTLCHVEGRAMGPAGFQFRSLMAQDQADQVSQGPGQNDLAAKIQSYYTSSGFPKAGRTLQQKIDEADAFWKQNFPKSGAIGVGTTIVYNDQVVYTKGFGLRRYNDTASSVTTDSLFEIGSVSKTFIALGVGVLIDDGKLQWNDAVKKHVSWFKLYDKYAEEHLRVGDLLSMNSGLGRNQDLPLYTGGHDTPRKFVESLDASEPMYPLRDTPAYANTNYEILGQVIEEVSGKPWQVFLKQRIWEPLGMKHTFGAVEDIPADLQKSLLNAGHLVCLNNVLGPLAMIGNLATVVSPTYKYVAAGSIVSSSNDMAKLLRLILNKGTVDGVKIFKSPATIAEMITGKNKAVNEYFGLGDRLYKLFGYLPDGDSLSAGYGFDVVGHLMWGHAYVAKGGDTTAHHASTGYAPYDNLAIATLVNSQSAPGAVLGRMEFYIMGIFLDVPKSILDYQFAQDLAAIRPPQAPIQEAPACGFAYWKDAPRLPVPSADSLVGVYEALSSPKYFPRVTFSRASVANGFDIQFGSLNFTVFHIANDSSTLLFQAEGEMAIASGVFAFTPDDDHPGKFILDMGTPYRWVQ